MYFKSKNISLIILGITAIVCSRALFMFFNDPEGPNLLVVIGMAGIIYFVSLALYASKMSFVSLVGLKRLLLAILVQVIITAGLYFFFS